MSGMNGQCPWGRESVDLSEVELTSAEKSWLGTQIFTKQCSVAELSEKYNLKTKVLYKYGDKVGQGAIFYEGDGRPPKVTSEQKKILIENLQHRELQLRTSDFHGKVQGMAKNTAESRHSIKEEDCTISPRTIARLEEELNISTGNAEPTTTARAAAVEDVRNTLTFAAMYSYMVPLRCLHGSLRSFQWLFFPLEIGIGSPLN